MKHEEVKITTNAGKELSVDKGIADLVLLFNNIGMETQYSCEGDEFSSPYILFHSNVTDNQIEDILLLIGEQNRLKGNFLKTIHMLKGQIVYRWRYEGFRKFNLSGDFEKLKSIVEKFQLKF